MTKTTVMSNIDVLIVGAGPTGLVLALWLSKLGIRVRIIDKATQAATSTRALAVQARILELYAQMHPDLANTVIQRGQRVTGFNVWVKGRHAFHAPITQIGEGMTPYPFIEIYPQHEHEQMLMERLHKEFGISVELDTELVSFEDDSKTDQVFARLRRKGSDGETLTAKYIAGCDGSHSAVRKNLGISFPGGTYDQLFYVADIEGTGPAMDGELHVCLDQADFLAIFPLAGTGRGRLIGTIRQSKCSIEADSLTIDDVSGLAIEHMKLDVTKVNWFSTHHVHHRVADHFRKGRAFLLGDAAHVHSPAGGQGMNTGIGDAINLSWKIASVLSGEANDSLLDTYEEERAHFARRLVATTDRAFTLATAEGWFARFIRTKIVPLVIPILFSFRAIRRFMFRRVSQISLHYRNMTLSLGSAGGVQGGERLPWVEVDGVSNHESLSSMRWQMHVYGKPKSTLVTWCKEKGVALTVFEYTAACAFVGLVRDAAYILRPDSYVGMVQTKIDNEAIERYFVDRQIRLPLL